MKRVKNNFIDHPVVPLDFSPETNPAIYYKDTRMEGEYGRNVGQMQNREAKKI